MTNIKGARAILVSQGMEVSLVFRTYERFILT